MLRKKKGRADDEKSEMMRKLHRIALDFVRRHPGRYRLRRRGILSGLKPPS